MKLQREKSKVYKYLSRHMFATIFSLIFSFVTVVTGMYFFQLELPEIDLLYQNISLRLLFGNLIFIVIGLILGFLIIFPLLARTIGKAFGLKFYKYTKVIYILLLIISSLFFSKYLLSFLNISLSLIVSFLGVYVFLTLFFVLYLLITVTVGKYIKSRR